MLRRNQWLTVALLFILALQLVGCGAGGDGYEKIEPYKLEKGENGINRVILTQRAEERLAVEIASVTETEIDGNMQKIVPYGALIYDNNGGTWIYINPEPLTYVREAVTVDYIEGDQVFLSEGPDVGTEIAIAAVAELYGSDTGVGK